MEEDTKPLAAYSVHSAWRWKLELELQGRRRWQSAKKATQKRRESKTVHSDNKTTDLRSPGNWESERLSASSSRILELSIVFSPIESVPKWNINQFRRKLPASVSNNSRIPNLSKIPDSRSTHILISTSRPEREVADEGRRYHSNDGNDSV